MKKEDTTKFKIQGIGLDTENIEYPISNNTVFDYIHTSISKNNDFIISDYIKKNCSISVLITSIDFLDNVSNSIVKHLEELDKSIVDLLLINSKCDFKNYNKEIKDMIDNGLVSEIGIKNPDTVEELELIEKEIKFNYVSLNICPLNFNYSVIKWCNEKGIKVICFNPFGGHISAAAMIDSFSVSYLLSFAAFNSDIVFLSGRDLFYAKVEKTYLESLIGREYGDDKFILKKNVNKLYKPLKKAINTSMEIECDYGNDKLIIPYNSPDVIVPFNEIYFNFSGQLITLNDNSVDENLQNNIEKEVYNLINILQRPKDGNIYDYISSARPSIIKLLKGKLLLDKVPKYQNENVYIDTIKVSDNIFAITAKIYRRKIGGWIKKKKLIESSRNFILCFINDKVYFKEL